MNDSREGLPRERGENPIKLLRFEDKRLWCCKGTMEEAKAIAKKMEKELGAKCVAII